jgi:hypothetical protein
VPSVPCPVEAALFLAPGFDQVVDLVALGGQISVCRECVVGEFPELCGHRPSAQFGVCHYRGAVTDPASQPGLAKPGRVAEGREHVARFGPSSSDGRRHVGYRALHGSHRIVRCWYRGLLNGRGHAVFKSGGR